MFLNERVWCPVSLSLGKRGLIGQSFFLFKSLKTAHALEHGAASALECDSARSLCPHLSEFDTAYVLGAWLCVKTRANLCNLHGISLVSVRDLARFAWQSGAVDIERRECPRAVRDALGSEVPCTPQPAVAEVAFAPPKSTLTMELE